MKCFARTQRISGGAWALALYLLGSLGPSGDTALAGTPIALNATHAGRVNFVGTAGSLRRGSNLGNACAVDNYDTAPLTDLPAGATVKAAYLYWAGSWSDQRRSNQRTPDWDITLDGVALTADRQFTETFGLGRNRYDFFSGVKDVTSIVSAKGNGLYTFGNLDVNTQRPHCDVQAVLAGWSLIVVYTHPAESNRVVNIFDGFQYYRGGQIAVTADNFQISAADINGKVGHLTWEGDAENSGILNGISEGLTFNGNNLLDAYNPLNNQFNSTVNVTGSADEWGVDLDIYDVTPYLNAGDTQAATVYRSGQDLVLLSAEIVSVTNIPLVDLGFTAAPDDPLGLYEPGQITLHLINYGPSDESLPVRVTATLPAGLTYTGTSSPGWTVDTNGLPTVTWTHPGPLPAGQSLPLVFDVIPLPAAVGAPDLAVAVGGGSFDFNLGNNTGIVPLNVVVPPAELISTSFAVTATDPINGSVNPKAIPGATVIYTLTTSNLKAGEVDRNSVEVVSPVPPQTMLFVNDFPGTSDGPIFFADGDPASTLTLGRGNFGGGTAAIFFSDDGGATFNYKPAPDALGYDAAVTHFRVEPSGTFAGRNERGPTSFALKFQVLLR
jgi:hypothetical protein